MLYTAASEMWQTKCFITLVYHIVNIKLEPAVWEHIFDNFHFMMAICDAFLASDLGKVSTNSMNESYSRMNGRYRIVNQCYAYNDCVQGTPTKFNRPPGKCGNIAPNPFVQICFSF